MQGKQELYPKGTGPKDAHTRPGIAFYKGALSVSAVALGLLRIAVWKMVLIFVLVACY
ncbi:hypothetical protein [Enterococcus asini]|uniref:hypothetical protein n=1 Tax=Enterococcus asini TaxID=57732 RepID=UPI0015F41346|nr:hypothetical protein [Enterococcus asini]